MKPLPLEEVAWVTKSSSATPIGLQQPLAISLQDIELVKSQFVEAAKNAISAGFDAIELHAAHGYLFHQFYSKLINKRTDEYGGSFENRIRLLTETIQEIRNEIPDKMPLLVRLSVIDYDDSPDGWTLEDSVRLAKNVKQVGVDFITASGGGFVNVSPTVLKPAYQLHLAVTIKEATGIAAGTVGIITDARQANDIIESGQSDLVVVAREHLRNPYFSINAALELEEAITIPWQYARAY